MTVLARSTCHDCGRICYERGGLVMIEGARDATGTCHADTFLNDLEDRARQGRSTDNLRLANILVRFEYLARDGTLTAPRQIKQLTDEIWEVKAGDVRILFYWTTDEHNRAVRLTHGFVKRGTRFSVRELRWAARIRKEDLES